ncbi:MAG: hypothetical protein J0H39_16110 [Alphaproteobacteria bacterium]|nr:hypothetical protein [Alphaproteobacteria bacterium]
MIDEIKAWFGRGKYRRLLLTRENAKSLVDWFGALPQNAEATFSRESALREFPNQPLDHTFDRRVREAVHNAVAANVSFDRNSQPDPIVLGSSVDFQETLVEGLRGVSIDAGGRYEFQNLKIGHIDVRHPCDLKLKACQVGRLRVRENMRIKLKLHHCTIRRIVFEPSALRVFRSVGGYALDLALPAANEGNPFVGEVTITDTQFPARSWGLPLLTAQAYRNMQAHLTALKNVPLRDHFHALELRFERTEGGWNFQGLMSWIYDWTSNYGQSAGRPMVWLFVLAALSAAFSYCFDLAVFVEESPKGWREIFTLCEPTAYRFDVTCNALKAAFLSVSQITNPLGLFNKEPIIVARDWWWALALTVQGLVSAVLVALTLLAIRRKFRTQE